MTYQDYINRTEQYKRDITALERKLQLLDKDLKDYNQKKEDEKDNYGNDIDRLIKFKRMSKWAIAMTIIALIATTISLGVNLFQDSIFTFLEQNFAIYATDAFLGGISLCSTVVAVASFLTVPIFSTISHLSKKDNQLKGTKGREMVDHIGEMQQEIDKTNIEKAQARDEVKKQLDAKRNEYQLLSNAYRIMYEKALERLHATMDIPDVETLAKEESPKVVPSQINPTPRQTPKVRVKLYPSR